MIIFINVLHNLRIIGVVFTTIRKILKLFVNIVLVKTRRLSCKRNSKINTSSQERDRGTQNGRSSLILVPAPFDFSINP